jgi:hypothetical protein
MQTAFPFLTAHFISGSQLRKFWYARGCHLTLVTPIHVSGDTATVRLVADKQRQSPSAGKWTSLNPPTYYDYRFTVSANHVSRLIARLAAASVAEKWLQNYNTGHDGLAASLWLPPASLRITDPSTNESFSSTEAVQKYWRVATSC